MGNIMKKIGTQYRFSKAGLTLTSIQSVIFTNIIHWFGYDGNAAVQKERAFQGIRIGAGLVPLIMGAIGFIPLLLFPIGKNQEKEISEYSAGVRRKTLISHETESSFCDSVK